MDIDATRKLRPQKTPVPPAEAVPPTPEDVKSKRFVASMTAAFGGERPPTVELDPITGWLVVMKGMGRGRSLPLGYGVHPVGRAEDQRVAIRFGDKKISRRSHVEVAYDGKTRAFQLLPGRGSTVGHHNGQPLLEPTLLRAGDRITLGDTELMFVPFCGETFDWRQDGSP